MSLASLGKPDFPCETVYLSDLEENFSPGPPLLAHAKYNNDRVEIEPAIYGEDPINITKIDLKCNIGYITNLINIGLSTQDTQCLSPELDDAIHIGQLVEQLSLDPRCSFSNLNNQSAEFDNVNEYFKTLIGKPNA